MKEIRFDGAAKEDSHVEHFKDLFENIKKGSVGTVEDPIFGFCTGAPVLAHNKSYFDKKIVHWHPSSMRIRK